MSQRVIVIVSEESDLPELSSARVITADRYLGGEEQYEEGTTVVNLCRSFRYRTKGYYVSLLADARGHVALPTVETVEALGEPFAIFRVLHETGIPTLDLADLRSRRRNLPATGLVNDDSSGPKAGGGRRNGSNGGGRKEAAEGSGAAEVLAYFGQCEDSRFRAAAQAAYREWPTPVLRIQFVMEDGEWKVAQVAPAPLSQLSEVERRPLIAAVEDEKSLSRRGSPTPHDSTRASIAVLFDEADPFCPSSPETLDRFERIAARRNVYVHRLGLDEIQRLAEYDALFIRSLTGVREPAFQFALRAEMLDMPVIDDSQSIIRCSNKVFLDELLKREGIATPRTLVATSRTSWDQLVELGLPIVIKLPDGSFSAAVHRIGSRGEYQKMSSEMFRRSPLIIAQEYLPTDYDWRVTILDGRVLFTARYFMARGHWQIRSERGGVERFGKVEAVPRESAPSAVVELALRAAALIGNGLYGVDLKETPAGPVVIEINDNPNLDTGFDDAADGQLIYEDILDFFLQRIEETPRATGMGADRGRREQARRAEPKTRRHFRPFSMAGIELEYPVVDAELNPVSLVEDALRSIAGRPTSDVIVDGAGFSNEIADHVFEIKTAEPLRSLRDAETVLARGVARFSSTLAREFGARLLPTGMHPWLDPHSARLWTRSNSRIYQTYARVFDIHSHGWMNVHAAHLNLPLGREREAVAMYNAAAILTPYLPALAASSPMYGGELGPAVDNRLSWIVEHQSIIPESCGAIVPEYIESFADYRKTVLAPMYRALDSHPESSALRHEFLNARGAVFKFSRKAMEIRVLDTQECVKMDIAIAVFVRSALRYLTRRILAGRLHRPDHDMLVHDFRQTVQSGSRARVMAPFLGEEVDRADDGSMLARDALCSVLEMARKSVRKGEDEYLDLVSLIIESGSLSERMRAALQPEPGSGQTLMESARGVYLELADCLEANEPWAGRGAAVQRGATAGP
jgi:glutathione synthase/RimK-type ligase-like ATP-grasp enzyme/gamma-glutamyl:cysteine ligase YbdK (ATP-grasp superfamily)